MDVFEDKSQEGWVAFLAQSRAEVDVGQIEPWAYS